ncbi:MAG: CPBP family intramembrane metalloprotease [Bdellovibrionales bacterium]|nr:CPBP family intramembrane metalloprotease [Bdellovibrionales bacterium]
MLFQELKRKDKILVTFILLSAPVLLSLYHYRAGMARFPEYFPALAAAEMGQVYAAGFQFACFFALFFLIPVLFLKFFQGERLGDFGLSWGDARYGLRLLVVLLPLVVVPMVYFGSQMPDVRAEYPLARVLLERHEWIPAYELLYVALYYVAWEFYFRGFMLFGLRRHCGDWPAILIQTIPSCLIHLGKPEGEIFGSIVTGLVWGWIALRTRSIWYVFVMHAAVGVLTDLFVIFGGHGP